MCCRFADREAPPCFSATAAEVNPHLLVLGASPLVFHTAGDEVWSAVAVPVSHANAGGLPGLSVGDKQLWRAELRHRPRAHVAAPVQPAPAPSIGTPIADAQEQVQQAVPVPIG